MYSKFFRFFIIISFFYVCNSAYSQETTKAESPGFFKSIEITITDIFSFLGKIFTKTDSDELYNQKSQKSSDELIRKDASVSEKLYFEFAGPRDIETAKASVDLNEVENQIAPLPAPEEPSKPENSKNLPIRKEIAKEADLKNIENEST